VNGMRNAFQAAQSGKPTAAASMATGDLGKIQTLVQQALAREAETKKAYLAEFTAVGLADFLKPGKISTRTDFAAVHAKARQAYAVIDKFEQRHAADLESFKQAVQALDVAPNPKADALRGMEQGVARGQAQQQKLDSLDREIVQVIDETATLLEHNRSHWIVQSGKFTFNDPALLSAFRQKLGMVEELGREENRVLVNMRANGEANLDRMDAAIQ